MARTNNIDGPEGGVLFDMDGTLVKFKINYIAARRVAINILREYSVPQEYLSEDLPILDMLGKSVEFLRSNLKMNDNDIIGVRLRVSEAVEEIEREAALSSEPIPGISDVLSFLKNNGIPIGVITLNTTQNALLSLEKSGLMEFFNERLVIGRDKTPNPKPNPEHAMILVRKMGVLPDHIILIGDHPYDVKCAKSFGGKGIGIISAKYGPSSYNDADFLISYSDIPGKLIKILKNLLELSD